MNNYLQKIKDGIEAQPFAKFMGFEAEDALIELLGELDPEFTEKLEPRFMCDCSRQKIEAALVSLGRDELADMIENDGGAELTCRFCGSRYVFNKEELTSLLEYASSGGAEDADR